MADDDEILGGPKPKVSRAYKWTEDEKAKLKALGVWDKAWKLKEAQRCKGFKAWEAKQQVLAYLMPAEGSLPVPLPEYSGPPVIPNPYAGGRGSKVTIPKDSPDGQRVMLKKAQDAVVTKDMFADKKPVGMNTVIEWVFNHYYVNDVMPGDAPSAGAWALLQAVRGDDELRKNFLCNSITKLIPTKTQLEQAGALQDDGRRQLSFIENLLAEAGEAGGSESILQDGAKDVQGES